MRKIAILLLLFSVQVLAVPVQDHDEGDTLKIGVKLVQLVFSAVDERNRPVSNLNASEVEVYENGTRQEIELFQRSHTLPMLLAILIDTSASQESLLPDEKNAAETFLDYYFREGRDYGAMLTFQGETRLEVGLTSNLRRLKTALRRIKRQQNFRDEDTDISDLGTALHDALLTTTREILSGETARRIIGEDETRRAIRRTIILLSDGKDTASTASLRKAIRNAQRAGVSVYALGLGDRFRYGEVARETLDQLAAETGGRAFYPANERDLEEAFRQIADELSSQYILAYYPSTSLERVRTIEVRFKSGRNLRALHRQSYTIDDTE